MATISGHLAEFGYGKYLIVPFWYALAAYQAGLVSPWVFRLDYLSQKYEPWFGQTHLVCRCTQFKKVSKRILWQVTSPPVERPQNKQRRGVLYPLHSKINLNLFLSTTRIEARIQTLFSLRWTSATFSSF